MYEPSLIIAYRSTESVHAFPTSGGVAVCNELKPKLFQVSVGFEVAINVPVSWSIALVFLRDYKALHSLLPRF